MRTILLSIVSMLSDANLSSPANVDAARMYRDWTDGRSTDYVDQIKLVFILLFCILFSLSDARWKSLKLTRPGTV